VANSPLNASFDSKESTTTSHAAELDIVFAGGGTLTGVTTASGSGLTGGGTSGTLTLSLTNACAANQVLQWSGTAWACANLKGSGTITGVTAGTDLTGGGTSGNVTLNLNTAVTNGLYAQLGAANTFTANQTVNGTLTANSSGFTIVGNTSSTATDAAGVIGEATATTGSTVGVAGGSSSPSGFGVTGGGGAVGVQGSTWLATGYGVEGVNEATSGNLATGVYGQTNSPAGGVGRGRHHLWELLLLSGGRRGYGRRDDFGYWLWRAGCQRRHHGDHGGRVRPVVFECWLWRVWGGEYRCLCLRKLHRRSGRRNRLGCPRDCDRLKQHGSV